MTYNFKTPRVSLPAFCRKAGWNGVVAIAKAEKLLADTQATVERLGEELENASGYETAMLYIAEFRDESSGIDREWEELALDT